MPDQGEFDFSNGAPGKLEAAFWAFHRENPNVYALLVRFARQWKISTNQNYCSINFLFERVRWEYAVEIRGDDTFRLNNNHRAFYARMIEDREPGFIGFFRKRQQKIQCTFGPSNDTLPPGDHIA